MPKQYCRYCGRVAHRCLCDTENSKLHQFFARNPNPPSGYYPNWMPSPYKRGVPPQVKRQVRYQLRKHADEWYMTLSEQYGEVCVNCGISPPEDNKLALDHIISIAKGGQSELSNLQLLCKTCNSLKGKLCIDCRSDTK
ncbi:MAG: HNH endonuclease signature motif containing protein [Chloroflexota bacterium]